MRSENKVVATRAAKAHARHVARPEARRIEKFNSNWQKELQERDALAPWHEQDHEPYRPWYRCANRQNREGDLIMTKYQLVRNGKVIFSSTRKLDAVFAHQKYRRKDGVGFREIKE